MALITSNNNAAGHCFVHIKRFRNGMFFKGCYLKKLKQKSITDFIKKQCTSKQNRLFQHDTFCLVLVC